MNYKQIKSTKKWMPVLIVLVGLTISLLFYNQYKNTNNPIVLLYPFHTLLITAGIWIGCMKIVEFLWNKFPWEQQPIKHLFLEIILILAYTNIFSYTLYKIEENIFNNTKLDEDLYLEIIITNLITLLITSFYEAFAFYNQWKFNFSKSVRLEKDNIEARFETLKQQINPHFLFNSLNSLTSLVEENEKAVGYIQDLSEFLRYTLKSGESELVLVRDELSILRKYINIQQTRFSENLFFEIEVSETKYQFSIPPLVLQILTENCIKHNIVSKVKPLTIKIFTENDYMVVENNLQPKANVDSTGTGLKNIVERYKFFTQKEVKIKQTTTKFKVSVPMLLVEL